MLLWHPDREGEIDIRVRMDGSWLHEGTVIHRNAIAKIFSTILRREGDTYYLVTPVEKLRIQVDDVPFIAVDMEACGTRRQQRIVFKTNMGEAVLLDEAHALTITQSGAGPRPYLHVRDNLHARLLSDVFYRLADLVEDADHDPLWIWSSGQRFRVS